MSINIWIDKENEAYAYICIHIYTHTMEYYSAFKMKEILKNMTTWINLKDISLS